MPSVAQGGAATGPAPGAETREREAAVRRGERRAGERAGGAAPARDPYTGVAAPGIAYRAFAALAENVRDYAIFLLDPRGVITFWGEGARLIKFWNKDQAEGAHLRMLYPDGGAEDGTAEEHLRESEERGEYTGEGSRVRADGSTFWAGVTLTALRGDDGTLLGFAKVTRDLTASRAAEAALRAAHDAAEAARVEAEAANRAKSMFLATMSHEIRTPINAVMGYADLLDMEIAGALTPLQRTQLGRIRASSMHLLGLVNEVLDFSRLEADRVAVGRAAARLGDAAAGALALVLPQAEARGLELDDRVSGSAADVPYWGDEARVRQVLVNLLSNAVKFTPPGGRVVVSGGTAEAPAPEAQVKGEGPWAFVRVEDTGSGIDPARLDAVFELFEQADMSLTRQHGGTGLGLAISRRLARLMGGDLTVRSEPGVGSSFFLWLPAAPAEAVGVVAGVEPRGAATSPGLLARVHDALLPELDQVLHAYVARLRSDPLTPTAHAMAEPELENHLATLLADVAQTLGGMDLAAGVGDESLRAGTEVQRTVADWHGRQRRRLGWGEAEVRREFQVLREELASCIRRRVRGEKPSEVERVLAAVDAFVDAAETVSLAGYGQADGS
ncbi:MAG TPA: ATP-binding protein [Longimicrobiaceae bacterium]|jgi:PAS domain S-box-containing protein